MTGRLWPAAAGLPATILLALLLFGGSAVADEWATDSRTGCSVWHGHSNPPANLSVTWSGACESGQGSGPGVLRFLENGAETARYEGSLAEGKAEGQGRFIKANGDSYEGGFRNGTFHGKGVLVSETGARYEGDFEDGTMHGQGVMTLPDGSRFEGHFLNGMPAGQ